MRHEQAIGQSSSYARQVWLAGLGVLGTLQKESSRLFNEFVKEGRRLEHKHVKEDSLAEAMVATKDAYQKKLETQLKEWDRQLDRLIAKAQKVRVDARVKIEDEFAVLRNKRVVVQKKLDELRNRGEDAWEDLKDGIEKAWDDVSDTLGKVVARFK
ncbi:MAG: phasin family protein [Candidatus Competibacteraceae bacterium]